MPKLADWVKETVSGTPGTGTITLGGAVAGYCRFQDNFATGDKVYYAIEDGNNREEGYGTLTTGTPWTLARTMPIRTIDAGTFDNTTPSAISLTSAAIVGISGSADTTGIIVGTAYTSISTLVTCSTLVPIDNTTPQNTEGTEVITLAYTPKFADSIIRIECGSSGIGNSASYVAVAALFVDSTADALSVTYSRASTYSAPPPKLEHEEISGNTSARTYKLRIGCDAGIFYANGSGTGSVLFNGKSKCFIHITEIRQ